MSSNEITYQQNLDNLFPVPSLPPSLLSPQRFPGSSPESVAALQHVLKDNHNRYHIYFNYKQFHKCVFTPPPVVDDVDRLISHVTHRALAIYALGGSASLIKDYYEQDANPQNMVGSFYQGYVTFFSKQIDEKGAAGTLEEFIFSEKYNFQDGRDVTSQPEMLFRFVGGAWHPMIHAGYGVEFGLKGMLAEGLALCAVEILSERGLYPPSAFVPIPTAEVHGTGDLLSSLVLNAPPATAPIICKTGGVHAFDIIARMLKDDQFKPKAVVDASQQFADTIAVLGTVIRRYAEMWTVDLTKPGEIERKMEELIWVSSVTYGVGGFDDGKAFKSDFFLLFLPSLIAYLSPRSQVSLLRAYFTMALILWVVRGRPALNVKAFMATTSIEPTIPNTPQAKTPPTTETTPIPNPFLPLIQSSLAHPNEHHIKIQRAFAHFNTLYGLRPLGYLAGTELEGAELLDGSLFVRAAVLTADAMGWDSEIVWFGLWFLIPLSRQCPYALLPASNVKPGQTVVILARRSWLRDLLNGRRGNVLHSLQKKEALWV
ncbi:hypothetical protein BU15DRAFT_64441 [Melanogaster broomeanus]|nr:hypothetical protein BU15DRAFT_64441 [Melanogaster broomeanus]